MTAVRASSLRIRTFTPADVSFWRMITPRLEALAGDVPIAQACLSTRCWSLLGKAVVVVLADPIGNFSTTIELSRKANGMADANIPAAEGIRVDCTADGMPTVEFLNDKGEPFAIAEFTPDMFARLIGECCDLLEIASKGGLATLKCVGEA